MKKKFRAKRSFIVYIALAILLAGAACLALFFPREPLWLYITTLSIYGVVLLLFIISICATFDVFKEDYLVVVNGLFRKKISYRMIESVEPCRTAFAAMCLAFEKIKISTGKGYIRKHYIAPVEIQEVIAELKARASEARKILEYRKDDNE